MGDAVDNPPRTIRVGVRELRANPTRFLRDVRAGTAIEVTVRDTVVAELRPPPLTLPTPRRPGTLRGKIRIADDFNTLPDHVLDAFEK